MDAPDSVCLCWFKWNAINQEVAFVTRLKSVRQLCHPLQCHRQQLHDLINTIFRSLVDHFEHLRVSVP